MNEVVERLIADMRWRLSAAGGRYRPSRRECESWGATTLGWPGKLLSGCGLHMAGMAAVVAFHDLNMVAASVPFMFLFLLGIPIAFWGGARLQPWLDLRAYRRQLERNERFALVEYERLLRRHIEMAQRDPAQGGPAEVQRLIELHGRLLAMLKEGAGDGFQPSPLRHEADLAEAVIESYDIPSDDEQLAALDSRLPEDLRAQLQDLDREAQPGAGPKTPEQPG